MTDPHLTVTLTGDQADSAEVVGKTLEAMDGLFREVARAQGIDPDALTVKVGRMYVVCDGDDCGRERPADGEGWVRRDGLDFCPDCAGGR